MPESRPMIEGPELDRIERWMLAVISHPGGAGPGAESPAARAILPGASIEDIVLPSAELTAAERLSVYANMYFWRLIDVLADDYPTVKHVLGGEEFARLAIDYLVGHPSTSYTLNKLGAAFVPFLEHEAGDVAHRSFVADVGRIEWAMEEVFDAADVAPIDTDTVLAVPTEDYAGKRFRIVPACRLLTLQYPANDFIQAVRDQRHADIPAPQTSHVLVYRNRHYRVYRMSLSREQFTILESLARGKTLGQALTACAELHAVELDPVIDSLSGWFREWSGDGLFCAIE